jgi:hypothetical protein
VSTFKNGLLSAAAIAALVSFGSLPSMAVTLTIDGSGTPYVEAGFQIDPIRIDNGNCDGASGKPCIALNTNETSTLTKFGGGAFTLDSFGFEFQGKPSVLTVTASSGATIVYDAGYDKNIWYVVLPAIADITSIVFGDTGTGNIRIDDIVVSFASVGEGALQATPLPAALPLFAAGLGALGLLGWRRKRKAQTNA